LNYDGQGLQKSKLRFGLHPEGHFNHCLALHNAVGVQNDRKVVSGTGRPDEVLDIASLAALVPIPAAIENPTLPAPIP